MRYKPNQERVDKLISQFWKYGYLTISRRYGKYLPDPKPVGKYEVDAIAKYKKKLAIGIVLGEEDFNDQKIRQKLTFLATRHAKYSRTNVKLFIGVVKRFAVNARSLISDLKEEHKKNIKLVVLDETRYN